MTISLLLVLLTGIFGAVMGSFAGAQVWRLRGRQLVQDKAAGEVYDKAEYKRLVGLTGHTTTEDRSQCLDCHHTLSWYDLVPLVSWLSTKGKCRYCHKPIGTFEPLIEIGTAALFVVFSLFWVGTYGFELASLIILGLWLAALTMFVILFVYDSKWFLLPDVIMFPLIGLSVIISGATVLFLQQTDVALSLLSAASGVGVLAGLYFVLWFVSKGMWVGFGDVKLGIALGILLLDWRLAFLTLLLANLIGVLVVLPGLLTKKLSRSTQVPFGPFLIIGFFISLLCGRALLQGYESVSTWLSSLLLML